MRHKRIIVSFYLLLSIACKELPKEAAIQTETIADTPPEKKADSSTFEDLEGNPIRLADYKGKKVLLNFWATWCRPCIEEMPALLQAEAILKDDNYVFLLASDQSIDKIKAFKEKKGFEFTYLKFNGAMSDFQIDALPTTFIYNEEGKSVHRIDGATIWNDPEIIKMLKAVE